jgi:hypothetical protein
MRQVKTTWQVNKERKCVASPFLSLPAAAQHKGYNTIRFSFLCVCMYIRNGWILANPSARKILADFHDGSGCLDPVVRFESLFTHL